MLTLIPERKPCGGQISFDNFGSRFLGPYESSAVYSGSLLPLQQTLISVITSVPFRKFQNAAIDHSFALTPSLSMHFNGGLTHAEPGDTLKRPGKAPADQVLKDVRRQTRRQYSAEEKVRIVKDCAARKISTSPAVEGIAASMYYSSEEGITILNGVPATYQRLKTGQYPENRRSRDTEGMNPVAGRRKLVDEPLRLGAIAPANTNGIAALGKNVAPTAAPIASPRA